MVDWQISYADIRMAIWVSYLLTFYPCNTSNHIFFFSVLVLWALETCYQFWCPLLRAQISFSAYFNNWLVNFGNYCSPMQAIFKPPKATRGGIPICFPQVLQYSCCPLCFVLGQYWAFMPFCFWSEDDSKCFECLNLSVWKLWNIGAAWICKEQDMDNRWWGSTTKLWW